MYSLSVSGEERGWRKDFEDFIGEEWLCMDEKGGGEREEQRLEETVD